MLASVIVVVGGVGLFLVGMLIMTDGLKGLAGDRLRRLLAGLTRTPTTGAIAGAIATAIIQSSSATTVTAIGFVGAGLLTFPQALGVIFGANIGTTVTGWLIAIIGFKLDIGSFVVPLVLVGVLLRLFGSPTARDIGWALAGFAMLFIGIETMQQGMSRFEGQLTPADFPDDTIFGRLQLVLLGILITLVTQSSSAGVATALVALSTGTISFAQAAALVIGMDVGTTFTAALATLGGSTATRRTGYAHVIYNMMTGIMAFVFFLPLIGLASDWLHAGGAGRAELALVGFHTAFNTIGVVLVLPFTEVFARFITRLVPHRGPSLLARLDERFLADPASAVDAVAATTRDIAKEAVRIAHGRLADGQCTSAVAVKIVDVTSATRAAQSFVDRIAVPPRSPEAAWRLRQSMHVLDHVHRLLRRCSQEERFKALASQYDLQPMVRSLLTGIRAFDVGHTEAGAAEQFDQVRLKLRATRNAFRERKIAAAMNREMTVPATIEALDSVRWLQRVAEHLWRIAVHLDALDDTTNNATVVGEDRAAWVARETL